jgi:hypothetical protein
MLPISSESSLSAYRSVVDTTDDASDEPDDAFRERLHPVFVIVWVASLVRVLGAVYDREVMGAEATLALMTFVAVSWYAIAAHARRPR